VLLQIKQHRKDALAGSQHENRLFSGELTIQKMQNTLSLPD